MAFDLASAAAATGVAKSSVLRAIKAGRISATRDDAGRWSVEPAELFKIFPPLPPAQPATLHHGAPERVTQLLEEQVAELRNMLAKMERREEDLQRDRDHWRTAFENTQRSLPAPPHHDAPPTQPTQPPDQAPQEAPPLQPASRLRRAWRWMQETGCLAALALALATNAVAQQQPQQQPPPPQDCYTVVIGGTSAILLDRCTGKTWGLDPSSGRRWIPIPVETTTEPTAPR